MDLMIFNIATGIFFIIAGVGLALFMQWSIKSEGDDLGYYYGGFLMGIFFFLGGCYKLFYPTSNIIAFPKIYSIPEACALLFVGILSLIITLFSKRHNKTDEFYGIVGGFIAGGAISAISIICFVFCLIK